MRKSYKKVKNPTRAKILRRKLSIRKKIIGTADTPRVSVTKTNKHLFVQVIDDAAGKTLFSVQTFGKNAVGKAANSESGKLVGNAVSENLKKHNIAKAVFDRGGRKYTGVIATVADSIRENGIQL
jgi:large subunit ribosomal protein L18